MATCPLIKRECIQEQCAWWWKWREHCVLVELPIRITEVENNITEMGNLIIDNLH